GLAGNVERRFAGESERIAMTLLPGDQMRQQRLRRLAVGNEIVVDEISCRRQTLRPHRVELGNDLLRRLEARIAAIERRYVAKFAAIRAAAGELQAGDEI